MAVYKTNKKWYCKFQLNGERRHFLCAGATTEKEALRLENQFKYKLQQQQNGVIPKDEKKYPSLKKVLDNYLKYSLLNRKVYKQDVARVKLVLSFWGETRKANAIVLSDIEELKSHLISIGRKPKTVNLYLGILRTAYNLALDNEWLEKNPFKGKKVNFKLKPRAIEYLKKDDENKLDSFMPDYFQPILITALNSGLRRGNIINLKWKQLDFNFRTIEITENKGNKHIKLPMNDTLYELFSNMEKISDYVFINPRTGNKWNTTAFNKEWRTIRQKAGLNNLKFHGLRHTVATRLAKENVPIPIIKEVMTHSDISTTMQYTHVDSLDVINAMNILTGFSSK